MVETTEWNMLNLVTCLGSSAAKSILTRGSMQQEAQLVGVALDGKLATLVHERINLDSTSSGSSMAVK
jgi:hypothetical protein